MSSADSGSNETSKLDGLLERRESLRQQLSLLPYAHGLAFAAFCCERLVPVFVAFSLMADVGNPKVVLQALDLVWRYLKEGASEGELALLLERRNIVHPEVEDVKYNSDLLYHPAWDAEGAVFAILISCFHTRPDTLVAIINRSTNVIDFYISSVSMPDLGFTSDYVAESEDFRAQMFDSPLMREELAKQQKDLDTLKSQAALDAAFWIISAPPLRSAELILSIAASYLYGFIGRSKSKMISWGLFLKVSINRPLA
jgi:uncharacterized protein YjaG (DUF416 family)